MLVQAPVSVLQQEPFTGTGHGLGVQEPLSVHALVDVGQAAWEVVVHAPVIWLQQEPCGGCGHGFGLQARSCVHVPPAAQLACVVVEHEPLVAQQLPVGGPQGFGEQVRPPVQVFPTEQVAWKETTHPPSEVQQVPVAGHGVGLQV